MAALILRHPTGDWVTACRTHAESSMDPSAASGFFQLAARLAKDAAGGIKRDATNFLVGIFGNDATHLRRVRIEGNLNGLDLTAIVLSDCHLSDAEFVNCEFDADTVFQRCIIDGRFAIDHCPGFELVEFRNCQLSASARSAVQAAQKSKASTITREQLHDGIADVLRRFRRGAAFNLRRQVDAVRYGVGRMVPFGPLLMDQMEKNEVLETFLAHGITMYKVKDREAAHIFVENRLLVGSLRQLADVMERKLEIP